MKKRNRAVYFRTLVTAGIVLLLAGVSVVVPIVRSEKGRVEKELDDKLSRRVNKLIGTSDYNAEASTAMYMDDPDSYYEMMSVYDYLRSTIRQDEPLNIETFHVDSEDVYVPVYMMSSVDPETDLEMQETLTYFEDDDNTRIYFWNQLLFMQESGLYFGSQETTSPGLESVSDSLSAMNLYSQREAGLEDVARDLLKNGDLDGWYKDYRYCTWFFFDGITEGSEELVSIDRMPFQVLSDEEQEALDADYGMTMKLSFIVFEDGTELLSGWRTKTIQISLVALAIWAFFMIVTAVLLYVFMKPEKRDGTVWVEVGPDGTVLDPDESSDGASSKAAPADMQAGSSEGKITESLADELLGFISQSEASMGPSGYLDQMRDLIEKRKAVPEETQKTVTDEDLKGGAEQ